KQDMERLQIGTENLYFQPKDKTASHKKAKIFHKALTRLKNNQGTYNNTAERIVMMENRLFRTELFFPADVPIGTYMVEVYLVRKKRIVSAEITPLIVSKTGINAEIYFFAYKYSFIYGIISVLIAALVGWLVSIVFKKK
ncbi:MAG: TIGR02186 family protein, partial [Alphaproteobacteria bacterium]|nr:TIGR02186 family protein [Alphaproteobacteria bacterium]